MESETCKKELVIEIPPDIVKQEADAVTVQYRRMARIPGFRPGRAPASLVRRHFQEDIRNEVVQTLLPKYFENAIKDQKMSVIGQPHFADLKFEEDSPLTCKATFEILPEFELGEYKGLEVEEGSTEVTEADVAQSLEELQQRAATFEPVEDRPARDGDYLTVNYRGVDGGDPEAKPLEASDAMVHLAGEGTVAAFTENLRGAKGGDVREFEVSYPEDYTTKPLAGKTLSYRVEIQAVRTKVVPALDDEFAKSVSEFKSIEELKTKISENLAARKKYETEAASKQGLLAQLVGSHSFPVPETLVEAQVEARLERFLSRLVSQGIDPRTVGIDWQKLRDDGRPEAEKDVRGSLILEKVADAESIAVSEGEIDDLIREVAEERHEAPAAVKTRLTHDGELPRIERRLRNQKALDLIYQNAQIKPKSEAVPDRAEG
ncbi:MAG TPA: trigger factor [Terriglobia bacterium]|nr:trigger factor [Terriglobia bacterium]HVB29757.1 trigger factor [Terriglobia bacterium]